MLRNARIPFFMGAIAAAAALVVGCAAPTDDVASSSSSVVAPEEGSVTIRFVQDGETTDVSTTISELSVAATKPVAGVSHRGVPVVDASAALSLSELELKLVTGETITLAGDGSSLRQVGVEGGPSAAWSADLSGLTYSGTAGEVSVDLSSIADASLRSSVAGYLALAGLGGALGNPGVIEPAPLLPLVFGGAFVISVGACLLGNHDCPKQASNACRPRGVKKVKAICGAGSDVDGKMRFGLHCSFRCR